MLFCLATWFAGGLFHDLQFTLPGVSNIYYGSEIGMVGGNDPENGEPLRWELV